LAGLICGQLAITWRPKAIKSDWAAQGAAFSAT